MKAGTLDEKRIGFVLFGILEMFVDSMLAVRS